MRQIYIGFFVLVCANVFRSYPIEPTWYISPGIQATYSFNKMFSMGLKISHLGQFLRIIIL